MLRESLFSIIFMIKIIIDILSIENSEETNKQFGIKKFYNKFYWNWERFFSPIGD